MDNRPDHELIDQALAGGAEAFDALVRRYQQRLVHSLEHVIGSRDDALEAAQQAFVSAWKNLSGFRRDSTFYSWLYRIAMNAAVTSLRRRRIETTSLEQLRDKGANPADRSPAARPDHRLETQEHVQLVREALQAIGEEFRQPLVLREIDGLSYEEIADALDIPVGTVRSRIFRARQELTERLRRQFPDEFSSVHRQRDAD